MAAIVIFVFLIVAAAVTVTVVVGAVFLYYKRKIDLKGESYSMCVYRKNVIIATTH